MNAVTEFGSNLDLLWDADPRMIGIRAARYKFVAKMLAGMGRVLEVGAGDGRLSRIVRQSVSILELTDKAPQAPDVLALDLTARRPEGEYDAIYALDVLEHVPGNDEASFMGNLCRALAPDGTCIIGMPSQESQIHASPISRAGHVNCKTEHALQLLMRRYFRCVYLFGMNDEVLHTGFGPMCHYRLALAAVKR